MSVSTGVDSLNTTLQKTHEWLLELTERGGFSGEAQAYSAMRAVLHALRDRLTPDQAAHLAAQVPMLVRGIYYEGWRPSATPTKERTRKAFLARVEEELRGTDVDAELACRAVFDLLASRISPDEGAEVACALPEEFRDLWPIPA
jgi:uncharacterized protein (DUF2267 family)